MKEYIEKKITSSIRKQSSSFLVLTTKVLPFTNLQKNEPRLHNLSGKPLPVSRCPFPQQITGRTDNNRPLTTL